MKYNKKIFISLGVFVVIIIFIGLAISSNKLGIVSKNNQDVTNQLPYYFIAIHNEPFYGDNAKGSIEEAYPLLKDMIAKADAYNIKLTLMFSAQWVDYIAASPERMTALNEWQASGHEISAHHHGVYHGNWDGYSGYPEATALEIRNEKARNVEKYVGDLNDYTTKLKQINPNISSGCTNEESDKKELPDAIIYGTCSGFSNHLGVGIREDDGSKPEKGINQYVTVGTYNGIERKWLAHSQITTNDRQLNSQKVMKTMDSNEVYGAVVHSSAREYESFIAFIEFLHQQDPAGKKSMTVTSIIEKQLLPEKKIEASLLEEIYDKPSIPAQGAQGKCGDGICDSVEKNDMNICPRDCQAEQPLTQKKPATYGKCGDGICDDKEKADSKLCPKDCV